MASDCVFCSVVAIISFVTVDPQRIGNDRLRQDVNGNFRLSGKALAAENQFVAFSTERTVHEFEETNDNVGVIAGTSPRALPGVSVSVVNGGVEEEVNQ